MDKKRQAVSDPDAAANLPPTKLYRPSEDPPAPAPSHHQPPPQAASSKPPDPSSLPDSFHPSESETILTFQRAQLAAKITEQERDLVWLRDKVEELRKLVAVLDAAPRAALYHMCAVREDLTFTLARIGLSRDIDLAESPIAAVMLNAEVVTNESLAEMPAAIKKLTAQIVLAIEAREQNPNPDLTIKKANEELHRRLREVSDQLERYAERDKQSLVSSTTFRDEYDDLREESSLQRRKIVALELKLKEKQKNAIAKQEELRNGDGLTASADLESSVKEPANPAGHSVSPQNEDKVAVDIAKALAEKRLEELKESHEENVRLTTELETMRVEIAKRDSNIVPIKTILDTGMYRTMEANLQQLYLKEKNWQMERDSLNEDRETERKDAQEQLVEANAAFEKSTGDLRRQMEELRRIADCAKVEKDKVGMKSEAKKIDAGDAASIIAAADIRAKVSEEMRDKLSRANVVLSKEIKTLQSQLKDAENQLKEKGPPDSRALITRIQQDLEEERLKSAGFIEEVESLSTMFSEVESDNEKLGKLLTEKEQILSKVMAERLRGRQLLTTVKEQNRVLTQGREVDGEKIKSLTTAVAASKKAAQEANAACLKGQLEARELASTLEKRRRIADDATVSSRTAIAEKEEMRRERDVHIARVEQVLLEYNKDRFQAKRLREQLEEAERRVKEAEETLQRHMENGHTSNEDSIRDEIIRELGKKLNCSIVTSRPKEVGLFRCGHLFSRQCTDNLIATRNRKCPICGKPFSNDDVRSIFF